VRVLAVRGKTASELPQFKENLIFLLRHIAEMGSILVLADLDPGQFGSGTFLVRSGSLKELHNGFQPRSQIGIRVVAKSAGAEYEILHLWLPYCEGP
jgi:hypothetical protein